MSAGKGSKRGPATVSPEELEEKWKEAFKKKGIDKIIKKEIRIEDTKKD